MIINNVQISDEELEQLIDIISGRTFKKYFQKNPNAFGKMLKGFRPESLTDEMATQLAKKNKDTPFIISYVEKKVQNWLEEIEKFKSEIMDCGAADAGALFHTLQQSVFADNLNLYFKIAGTNYSEEFIVETQKAIEVYGIPFEVLSKERGDGNLLGKTNVEAIEDEEELIEARQELSRLNSELEKAFKEREDLERKLEMAEVLNKELSGRLAETENLSTYDDREIVERTDEFPYISVCQVYKDYNGQPWLTRIADIDDRQKIIRFRKIDWEPPYFSNRDRLFHKDGMNQEGDIGVWKWNAVQNKTNPEADYVTTAFCGEIALTQIVAIPDAASVKELCDSLSRGIQFTSNFAKILFVYRTDNDLYEGILCREKDLLIVNGLTKLKSDVVVLPQYRIRTDDILRIDGIDIIAHVGLGTPDSLCKTMDPYTVVKELLLSRLTMSYLRGKGLNRKEAQTYQQFLREVISEDIYEEMAEKYSCTIENAKYFIDRFVDISDRYLAAEEIEIDLLARSIEHLPNIAEHAKELVRKEWENENAEEIEKKSQEIFELSHSIENQKKELSEMREALRLVMDDISAKERLASSVEQEVADRIKDAQKSIAGLVVDASLLSSVLNLSGHNGEVAIENLREGFCLPVTSEKVDDVIEEIDIFEDELADNLKKSGYSTDGAIEIAQLSAFCIVEKMPMVCSSNSLSIANCIAATLGENEIYVLDVPINKHMDVAKILESEQGKHKVIVIQNAFDTFGAGIFNSVATILHIWTEPVLVIFSIDGVNPTDIPFSVWNRAFFVDGDVDYTDFPTEDVWSFTCSVRFDKLLVGSPNKKVLGSWCAFIDNQAAANYAKFISMRNNSLNQPVPVSVLRQIAMWAKAREKTEEFKEKIANEGISQKDLNRIRILSRGE